MGGQLPMRADAGQRWTIAGLHGAALAARRWTQGQLNLASQADFGPSCRQVGITVSPVAVYRFTDCAIMWPRCFLRQAGVTK